MNKSTFESTSFFLDTNSFINLSGLDSHDLSVLSEAIAKNRIGICMSHIQIDEQSNHAFNDYRLKIENALNKLKGKGVIVAIEPTHEIVVGVSRLGYAEFGSKELGDIDKALRKEIEKCEKGKRKTVLNIARDALTALSSLNHDFFVTADRCLFRAWKNIIENNEENKKTLPQNCKIPQIIHKKTPKGVFQAIMESSS